MLLPLILFACGGEQSKPATNAGSSSAKPESGGNPSYDPNRGVGKFTKVEIGAALDATMAAAGEKVFGVKCSSCHKRTEERLVGPGWKNVTKKFTGCKWQVQSLFTQFYISRKEQKSFEASSNCRLKP